MKSSMHRNCFRNVMTTLVIAQVLLFAVFPTAVFAQCTNCTTTIVGTDTVHRFTSGAGTFSVPPGVTSVNYLVVAGGGGAGAGINTFFFTTYNHGGGGGGAGGLRSGSLAVASGTYNIIVGAGGTAGVAGNGGDGSNSSFATISATGGGGGGQAGSDGRPGGSGGGGGGQANGAAGSAGQGNGAGNGHGAFFDNRGGGGGGGASATGANGTENTGGNGGAGTASALSGASVTYARGGNGGGSSSINGAAGAANTGNGGIGGWSASGSGGAGGSGVVIIRYPTPPGVYYSRASGNWNTNATWSTAACGGAAATSTPHSGAQVVICPGDDVTLNVTTSIAGLEFTSGAAASLTHSGTNGLTLGSGGVVINGVSNGTGTNAWNINAGSATVNGSVTLNGGNNNNRLTELNLTSGILDINGSLTFGSNPARTTMTATGAANIFLSGSLLLAEGSGRFLPGSASTFTYDGTGTQSVLVGVSDIDYYNLVLGGSGTKTQVTNNWGRTIAGDTTVNAGVIFNNSASLTYQGQFINNGTTVASASQLYLGNFVNSGSYTYSAGGQQQYRANFTNSGSFTPGAGEHRFNGSTAQVLTGTTSFGVMGVDNNQGISIANDVTVQTQLELANGVVSTGANVLRVAQPGSWSGINRTNGWVAGNLGLWFPSGFQGYLFPLGDATDYRPLTVTFANVTSAGFVVASVSQAAGDHPDIGSSDLDASQSVNRWWRLTNEGVVAPSYDAVFGFVAADVDGGADPQAFVVRRWDGGSWSSNTIGARSATSTQITGATDFGDFAIAEPIGPPVLPAPVAEYRMDEAAWDGTAGEVNDSSGNGAHGTAQGGANTDNTTPAIPGNPGSCRYGEFDGVDDYIQVPGISSTLNATASLAFWIRTTQTGNNTGWQAPGVAGVEQNGGADDIFWGWLDAAGRIGVSVANDFTTKSTVSINNGSWRHVVLTRDHLAGTYKIYIDGVLNISGNIATGVIGTGYTSLGRIEDTGGTPEYLQGDLDEVRLYNGVLSDSDVVDIMAVTRPCEVDFCPLGTPQSGLVGSYFNGTTLSGGVVGSRVDTLVNFNWAGGSPGVAGIGADQFSVSWNGFVRVTESGDYRFRTISDDGVRLTVDGQVVIERWNDHGATTDTSAPITLTAGQAYPVTLEYYENGGQSQIRLQWSTPSNGSYVAIPGGPTPLGAGLYSCANNSVGYYEISHSGTGITCEAEPITITAYNAVGDVMNPPNGTTITLSTTPATGTWAGGNAYTFDGTESFVVKYLRQTTPATLNIDVGDGIASESSSADPDITFDDIGLKFYGNTALSPLPSQVAGVLDPDMVLRVVEADNDTGACVTRLQNTARDVALGYECRNPTACSAGQSLTLNGGAIAANNDGAAINYSTLTLNFDVDGFAAIPFAFTDVGVVRLHAQLTLPEENDDPAITVAGSSANFIVKPYALAVIAVESATAVPNPGGTQTGDSFVRAGDAFVVRAEGRNAQGNRTPAFGRETSPESVEVNLAELTFPAAGNLGSLSNVQAFTPMPAVPGVYENTNIAWSEVGSMRLQPVLADNDYLGAGAVAEPDTPSEVIGRFYPADINLNASSVTNSCAVGGFSYLSEPAIDLAYQVEARNALGARTFNYDNASLNFPTTLLTLHGENNNDGVDLAARINAINGNWINGIFAITDNAAALLRRTDSGNVVVDAPLMTVQLGLRSSGVDNVNFDTLDFNPDTSNDCVADGNCDGVALTGSLQMRFGRLLVRDVHGPESAPIPMVWQTEYWDGSGFVLNSNDHCTQLPLTAVSFVGATTSVNDAADQITVTLGGISSVFDFSDPVGASDCLTPTAIGFCDGRAGLQYGAPGSQVNYPIEFDLSALPHLQSDWNLDGDYSDPTHPRVNVRFQHYRGHDRVIYWREILQ